MSRCQLIKEAMPVRNFRKIIKDTYVHILFNASPAIIIKYSSPTEYKFYISMARVKMHIRRASINNNFTRYCAGEGI